MPGTVVMVLTVNPNAGAAGPDTFRGRGPIRLSFRP
jgi:hypothetical protein